MAVTRKELREASRHFDARRRDENIFIIRRDFRRITMVAHLASDTLPRNPEEALKALALPEDYGKVIYHLGICCPKTRRIANRCLGIWNMMDSNDFMETMRAAFFDGEGRLRKTPIDRLFADFLDALQQRRKDERDICSQMKTAYMEAAKQR